MLFQLPQAHQTPKFFRKQLERRFLLFSEAIVWTVGLSVAQGPAASTSPRNLWEMPVLRSYSELTGAVSSNAVFISPIGNSDTSLKTTGLDWKAKHQVLQTSICVWIINSTNKNSFHRKGIWEGLQLSSHTCRVVSHSSTHDSVEYTERDWVEEYSQDLFIHTCLRDCVVLPTHQFYSDMPATLPGAVQGPSLTLVKMPPKIVKSLSWKWV